MGGAASTGLLGERGDSGGGVMTRRPSCRGGMKNGRRVDVDDIVCCNDCSYSDDCDWAVPFPDL